MENRRYTKELYTKLSVEERAGITDELVDYHSEKQKVEAEKVAANAEFNGSIKSIEAKMDGLFDKLERNTTLGEIECEDIIDEATKQVITKRLDTGAIIEVRALTEEELQRDFLFDEIEVSESIPKRENNVLTDELAVIQRRSEKEWKDKLFTREVSDDEVTTWPVEIYRTVASWAALVFYALDNPDKLVDVGYTPEILLQEPAEDDSEAGLEETAADGEPEDPFVEMDFWNEGEPVKVSVKREDVPAEYTICRLVDYKKGRKKCAVEFYGENEKVVGEAKAKVVS